MMKKITFMVSKHSLSSLFTKYNQNFPQIRGRSSSGSKRKIAERRTAGLILTNYVNGPCYI